MIRSFLLLLLTATVNSYAQNPYVLNGWARQDNCHCYTLTTETPLFQKSSIWNNNKIDLTKPFDYSFNVYLGCNDAGADGMVFALQTSSSSLGVDGAGMGFQNITPSLGVTIDTYYNDFQDDPLYDHIALQANGDTYHNSVNNLAGPVQALAGSDNIEDCKWHVLEVNWQPSNKLMQVSLDGVSRLSLTKDIIADIFNNDPIVYWGFTGSTGSGGNLQQMCTTLQAGFTLAAYTNTCVGTPFTFVDSSVSFGSVSNWYWNFGDGTTSTLQNPPPHAYALPGNYTASLNIMDGSGCISDTFKQDIAIAAYPVADFKVNAEPICANSDAVFTDATTLSTGTLNYWYWDFGNGATSNMQNPPPVDYAKGNYSVRLFVNTKENCASDTITKNFAVNSVDIDFTNSNDTCKNIPIEFTAKNLSTGININQWNWNFGDNNFSTDPMVSHTYTNGGTYKTTLVATADNGCISDTITKPVIVYATNADAGEDATVILGMPYQLNGSGGDIYRWSPATGLSNSYISNPIATIFDDVTYVLTASTTRGCATKDSVHLKVMKDPELYVPTAFTPNGDGRNDHFKFVPVGMSEISFFRIVNRWGQVMYSSKNSSDGWDGSFNGIQQPAGTYVWMIAGKSMEGKYIKRGNIGFDKIKHYNDRLLYNLKCINFAYMNFEYKHLLPTDFNDNSRVWIYQGSRLFTLNEALHIEDMLNNLVANWNAHRAPVKGYANLFFGQFIILMADETATGVSGCSIDSSVRIIQQIEKQFGVEMFNWQNLAFVIKDKVQIIPRQQFSYALENNFISPDTLFFNNVVATRKELEENWIIPIKDSWLKAKIKTAIH